jgi:hypothetical protein
MPSIVGDMSLDGIDSAKAQQSIRVKARLHDQRLASLVRREAPPSERHSG